MEQTRFRKLGSVLVVFILLVFALLPQPTHATTIEMPAMYLADTELSYGIGLFAILWTTYIPEASPDYWSKLGTFSASQICYWKMRVYVISWLGEQMSELTSGLTTLFSRSSNGEGLQNATWTPPYTTLQRNETIEIDFYYTIGSTTGLYTDSANALTAATYMTASQGSIALLNTTWTISLYTYRLYPSSLKTESRLYFNNATYNSKIENIQYEDGVTTPTEESIVAMAPFFIMGALIMLPIGLLLGKKT